MKWGSTSPDQFRPRPLWSVGGLAPGVPSLGGSRLRLQL